MKFRPAVFTKTNPHYQQEQKAHGEGREKKRVRTESTQVVPEAASGIKMPSCSPRKELHHHCGYFMDKNTWKPNHLSLV